MRGRAPVDPGFAPVQAQTFLSDDGCVLDTVYSDASSGTYRYSSALASREFSFTGTQFSITATSNVPGNTAAAQLVVTIDGVTQIVQLTPDGVSRYYAFAGLSNANHTVCILEGPQNIISGTPNPTPRPGGTWVQSISTPRGSNPVFTRATAPLRRCVVVGDSIANGYISTTFGINGWTAQARATYPGRLTVLGWGGMQLNHWASVLSTLASTIATACDGTVRNDLIFALGTNDVINGTSASFGASQLAVLQDPALAAVIGLHVYVLSPIPLTGEGATMTALRAACAANATTVGGTLIVGTGLGLTPPASSDYNGDGIHPTDAGHTKIATGVRSAVGW